MKKLIPLLFIVVLIATGCPQPEPEVQTVEIGLFTPYAIYPDILNGKVKEVVEKNYIGMEEDGKIMKGERLNKAARDTINWSQDFKVYFDSNGNITECLTIDENDAVITKEKTTVESNRISRSQTIRDDTVRMVSEMYYGETGLLEKIVHMRMPVDTLVRTILVVTDENGNFLDMQLYNPFEEPTGNYKFMVDENGRRKGYQYYNKDGQMTVSQKFSYNEKGFMENQVITDKEGKEYISKYTYEYDDMGNWIKAYAISDPIPIIEERTITYYED